MEFNIKMSPDFYSRVRLPYSQIIQSLNFLFNNDDENHLTTARMNCQFITPDRSNIFGSQLIDSKKLNYLIEKHQSHLPRLSTNHLTNQILSDQLLSNYYASMSVATVTNNQISLHGQIANPNKPPQRKKWSNDYSISLSKEENEYLFSLLGERCVTLATAVIQLFLSEQPNHTRWRKKLTGVACFIKDNKKRNYFIRVYDLDHAQTCVWQQELYFTFQYRCPRPYFHTFEADNCMAALNFATDKEADNFRKGYLHYLERKKAQQQRLNAVNHQPFTVAGLGNLAVNTSSYSSNPIIKEHKKKDKKDKKDKKKYCKEDISLPTNFQHLHHVGWNSGAIDSQLKQVLEEAGVSSQQYTNPETRQFIDQFVQDYTTKQNSTQINNNNSTNYNSYNGYQSVNRYNQPKLPPPIPQSQPSYTYYSANQQLTNNNLNSQQYSSQIPKTNLPPAVPGSKTAPPPPPPPPISAIPQPPSSNNSIPPPPPPPPMPTLSIASNNNNNSTTAIKPPPPPLPNSTTANQNNNQSADSSRSALLDQIRQGRKLNRVDPATANNLSANSNSSCNSQSSGGGDTRDALLDQIRGGVKLKSVEKNQTDKPASTLNTSGLAGALAKALQERSRVLHETDDSSSSDSSGLEDEEWDD